MISQCKEVRGLESGTDQLLEKGDIPAETEHRFGHLAIVRVLQLNGTQALTGPGRRYRNVDFLLREVGFRQTEVRDIPLELNLATVQMVAKEQSQFVLKTEFVVDLDGSRANIPNEILDVQVKLHLHPAT